MERAERVNISLCPNLPLTFLKYGLLSKTKLNSKNVKGSIHTITYVGEY